MKSVGDWNLGLIESGSLIHAACDLIMVDHTGIYPGQGLCMAVTWLTNVREHQNKVTQH